MPPSRLKNPALKKKRMDFVHQLDKSIFALILFSYFLDPSLFVLICRGITQTQISRPHESHPTSTLRTLTLLLLFNFVGTTMYTASWGAMGTETEVKGVFLDFVGQATPTSPLHLHFLSLLLLFLQCLCLLVAFESTPAFVPPTPSPPSTPTPTLVAPPPSPRPETVILPSGQLYRPTRAPRPRPPSPPGHQDPDEGLDDVAVGRDGEVEEEEEEQVEQEEDFLSRYVARQRRGSGRQREREGEEVGLGLMETSDWGKEEEVEDEEDEGGSIMALRVWPTLRRLFGTGGGS